MSNSDYGTDFYAWTQAQATALRDKDVAALDVDHLAEEIEALGRSDQHAIGRQLQRLLMHLLKWHYQPFHRTPSWDTSIDEAREFISDLIEVSPSLHVVPAQRFERAYRRARRQASKETGLTLHTFPDACPWTLADVLTDDWLPPEAL
jgi:integrase